METLPETRAEMAATFGLILLFGVVCAAMGVLCAVAWESEPVEMPKTAHASQIA